MHKFLAVLLCVLLGLACYRSALIRGRNPYLWFGIGLLFGIFGLITLFLLPPVRHKLAVVASAAPKTLKTPPLEALHETHAGKLWYYLDLQNTQYGPMSLNALGNAWLEGKVNLTTYVWHEDLTEWRPLADVLKPA